MPWQPSEYGEIPTLGYAVAEWIETYLTIPDGESAGMPFVMTNWQYQFTLDMYALDPSNGRRANRRGAAILPKGIGKSPWAAALAICEFTGPVLFDGWDANGQPVGKPLATPWVQIAATAVDQTDNTYSSLYQMVAESDMFAAEYTEVDIGRTRIFKKNHAGAKMEPVTSEAGTREGQRVTFAVLDETGLWRPNNGGISLAGTLRRNVAKMGGSSLETSNAFVPGEGSVAENTALSRDAMLEGRTKEVGGIVYLHSQAPADTDLSDKDSLIAGLRVAYMNTPWIDYERLVSEIWDPSNDPGDMRRFYLNQIVSPTDSWVDALDWEQCKATDNLVVDGEQVALGFDGSINNDSTALVGCRVSDGHLFLIEAWEKPLGPDGDDWAVDMQEVDAYVRRAFEQYKVAAFFADPPHWQNYIDAWTADLANDLPVKASQAHPLKFYTANNTQMVRALERLHTAIGAKTVTHEDNVVLTNHVTNARRVMTRSGLVIRKAAPMSPLKIDAAMAAAIAYEARSMCVAKNIKPHKPQVLIRVR